MPELPEVEIMTRNMHHWCHGQALASIDVLDPSLAVTWGASAPSLVGQRLGAPWRRGKYLCQPVGDRVLIIHFRMTGKVVQEVDGPRRHVRLRLKLPSGPPIALVDTRRLGRVSLCSGSDTDAFFEAIPLGPEPWPVSRDGDWWRARLAGLRGSLKGALMRQDRVAGLGNIAASEICFRARIDPRVCVPALRPADWSAVASAVPAFIEGVLAAESGPEIAYINEGRHAPNPFLTYAREGMSCKVCEEGTIMRFVQAGRSTFACDICQTHR